MGKETKISWCTATWNPWRGCTKVTKACDHCYMFRDQRRYGRDPETIVRAAPATFNAPLKWDDPELIFTCSWSDWFHVDADPWRDEAWDIIRRTPQHTYMVLTKRPGRIHRCLPDDWGDGYPNVWLGVSIEDAAVTYRANQLRRIPAAMRFISAEPLLGTLYPSAAAIKCPTGLACSGCRYCETERERVEKQRLNLDGIDLVIVGGESGSRADARPMHPDWACEIRDAVQIEADARDDGHGETVAFHFKQWGAYSPVGPTERGVHPGDVCLSEDGTIDVADSSYVCFANESDGTVMRYRGGSPDAGGKLLDGVEWCELPEWKEVRA